ncbi:unnamed protein product [Albugo candida]|uniref:Uncharacterized protein n=2 Tax=Albugo candida TaxID=65357 RepID=A0A024GK23_9STRA|nr:unnamed protein product [Albugo candida]|eukprot:CCI46684.1 unnamed protein product [Albugo candida]
MAIAMSTASRLFVCTRTHSLDLSARFFSSSGQIRRRKPVRLGRDEARRKIEPKEQTQQSEAVTNYQEQLPAEAPFLSNNNAPQNLKTVLKESFFWGIGITLAFTLVGAIFGAMEQTDKPGCFAATKVIEELDKETE